MRLRGGLAAAAVLLGVFGLVCAAAGDSGGSEAGRRLFVKDAQPACGVCHTLASAGTSGAVGPDLDELKPDRGRIVAAVRNGVGVMPAYDEQLSEVQIEALADFVARSVGNGT
jgi:sulfite dehydrogenase